jgi:hypothetical protein
VVKIRSNFVKSSVALTALVMCCCLPGVWGQCAPASSKPEAVHGPDNSRANLGRAWPTVKRGDVEPTLLAKLDQITGQTIYSCAELAPIVQIDKGRLRQGPGPVPLPALQPLRVEGVYVVSHRDPGYARIQPDPPAGPMKFVVVLHLASDQYAGIQVTGSPERLRASVDPLNELLGADSHVFVNPANFPFSEREIETIFTRRFEVGDSEEVVRCSIGYRKYSSTYDAAGREVRTMTMSG